jgi:hypothetical protein
MTKCKSNERSAFSKVWIVNTESRRYKVIRRKRKMPLCNEEENVVRILLKCNETNETQRWKEQFLRIKWLHINEKKKHKFSLELCVTTQNYSVVLFVRKKPERSQCLIST